MRDLLWDAAVFVGGQWRSGAGGEAVSCLSPATGTEIGVILDSPPAGIDAAVAAARDAFEDYRRTTGWQRAAVCDRVADVLAASKAALARVVSSESGKPVHTEALAEIEMSIRGFRNAAVFARGPYAELVPVERPGKLALMRRIPIGVWAVVTPWNFPVNVPTQYIASALATGNTVVWVPSPRGALCAKALAEALLEADVPTGAVNLVTAAGPTVPAHLVSHGMVDGVGFTGSTSTGQLVAASAGNRPRILELGGNGPTVVFGDADLPRAARSIARGVTFNAGQCCNAPGAILVEAEAKSAFVPLLVEEILRIRVGMPDSKDADMGPVNNQAVTQKVKAHIGDALERGASLMTGGWPLDGYPTPLFLNPAVLTDVPVDSLAFREETFGPLAAVTGFDSRGQLRDLLAMPQFGLASSVWTASMGTALAMVDQTRVGLINVNDAPNYWEPHLAFGGYTGSMSGTGRLGGHDQYLAMLQSQTVTVQLGDV